MEERKDTYPRPLTEKEWTLVEWILPEDRNGYREYRSHLKSLHVIGPGRWGEGDIILGKPGDTPDISGPMERIIASGIIETAEGKITVSVHEYVAGQLEVQITNLHNEEIPDQPTIKRRFTYSVWKPGDSCPFCGEPVREVTVNPETPVALLSICRNDKSIWLYDETDGINHPIPETNFHNELMLHKKIKDPSIALQAKNLYSMLDDYSDSDLQQAFVRYNKTWRRISIQPNAESGLPEKKKFSEKLTSIIKGSKK